MQKKWGFKFTLASDPDRTLLAKFRLWNPEVPAPVSAYGCPVLTYARATRCPVLTYEMSGTDLLARRTVFASMQGSAVLTSGMVLGGGARGHDRQAELPDRHEHLVRYPSRLHVIRADCARYPSRLHVIGRAAAEHNPEEPQPDVSRACFCRKFAEVFRSVGVAGHGET
eukprot:1842083-Rhodomonas_salina.1